MEHVIKKLILEVTVANERKYESIKIDIHYFAENELPKLIQTSLDKHVPTDVMIEIKNLSLDPISFNPTQFNFKTLKNQILETVQRTIKADIAKYILDPQKRYVTPMPQTKLEALRKYLMHGYLDWWLTAKNKNSIENIYLELLQTSPTSIQKLWQDLQHNETAIERFSSQFGNKTIEKTISLLAGKNIKRIQSIISDLQFIYSTELRKKINENRYHTALKSSTIYNLLRLEKTNSEEDLAHSFIKTITTILQIRPTEFYSFIRQAQTEKNYTFQSKIDVNISRDTTSVQKKENKNLIDTLLTKLNGISPYLATSAVDEINEIILLIKEILKTDSAKNKEFLKQALSTTKPCILTNYFFIKKVVEEIRPDFLNVFNNFQKQTNNTNLLSNETFLLKTTECIINEKPYTDYSKSVQSIIKSTESNTSLFLDIKSYLLSGILDTKYKDEKALLDRLLDSKSYRDTLYILPQLIVDTPPPKFVLEKFIAPILLKELKITKTQLGRYNGLLAIALYQQSIKPHTGNALIAAAMLRAITNNNSENDLFKNAIFYLSQYSKIDLRQIAKNILAHTSIPQSSRAELEIVLSKFDNKDTLSPVLNNDILESLSRIEPEITHQLKKNNDLQLAIQNTKPNDTETILTNWHAFANTGKIPYAYKSYVELIDDVLSLSQKQYLLLISSSISSPLTLRTIVDNFSDDELIKLLMKFDNNAISVLQYTKEIYAILANNLSQPSIMNLRNTLWQVSLPKSIVSKLDLNIKNWLNTTLDVVSQELKTPRTQLEAILLSHTRLYENKLYALLNSIASESIINPIQLLRKLLAPSERYLPLTETTIQNIEKTIKPILHSHPNEISEIFLSHNLTSDNIKTLIEHLSIDTITELIKILNEEAYTQLMHNNSIAIDKNQKDNATTALYHLLETEKKSINEKDINLSQPSASIIDTQEKESTFYIENGFIAVLWPFLETLFENLGLMKNSEFSSASSLNNAIHVLNYLCSNKFRASEWKLPFLKVLCGIPIEQLIDTHYQPQNGALPKELINITDTDDIIFTENLENLAPQERLVYEEVRSVIASCNDFINAVIQEWSSLRYLNRYDDFKTGITVQQFKGYFLQRNCIFKKITNTTNNYLHLTIPPHEYDSLSLLPHWPLDTIQLPWMQQNLILFWI